ncbi:signal peptidase I [Nocardioidaceae bacterium]|nr:signal peptidase I [Nocardioidaceae bacterium]
MLVAMVGAVVLASVVVPRVTGAQTYTILTSSMEPSLSPATIVVVRPTAIEDVAVGDVVTYQLESGQERTVTHRVVGLAAAASGERRLLTQGDANETPDTELVRAEQVRGTVWYSLPWVGHIGVVLGTEQRTVLSRAAGGLLIAYAAVLVLRGVRDRRRGTDGGKAS